MNIHEYQAKELLRKYGIMVPDFVIAKTAEEIDRAADLLKVDKAVVKIQVHAGGRGKAGGVKLAKSKTEISRYGRELLNMRIVNNQTGPGGVVARQVMVSVLVDFVKEYYVGAIIDRSSLQAWMILSPEGGMEIEEIAAKKPEKILKIPITFDGRVRGFHLLHAVKFMGWSGKAAEEGKRLLPLLARLFVDADASLLEINPLVLTEDQRLIPLDAKLSVDDNALFRQLDLAKWDDPTQLTHHEALAHQQGLAYVALDGEIGCMVNGAGLAMATMDIIHLFGGRPANFLDVGGGASEDKIAEGFRIILGDPQVKTILVNIFGGIMNCGTLAAGILTAAKTLDVKVPLVVRMEGTNVEEGKRLLAESKLNIILAKDLADAAKKAVEARR